MNKADGQCSNNQRNRISSQAEHKCLYSMKVRFALKIDISKRLRHFSFHPLAMQPFFWHRCEHWIETNYLLNDTHVVIKYLACLKLPYKLLGNRYFIICSTSQSAAIR